MNSALQTDLYQLTMAAAYFHAGKTEQDSVFHLFFRRLPFSGGYAIAAGLENALEWLENFRFQKDDLQYLRTLKTKNGTALFSQEFLSYLADLRLHLDIDAIPEGTLAFPQQPLLRVQGPILQAQLVETALLNLINFQTLIATKAARICHAAGAPVLEFGYRRAQGPDGGLTASRAAYIGGCSSTSNVLAGQKYGIPVSGTHAHSWVMSFDDEQDAFDSYAEAMPDNSILLVDTYNTLDGIRHAIRTAGKLRQNGHQLTGIRLDSGDLAWLSQKAREMLDEAGLPEVKIVASNDLDEEVIESLRYQGAKIDFYGVGTQLVTAAGQPALGGVYKLTALKQADGSWKPRIKVSEQRIKSTLPGRLQVRRFFSGDRFVGDGIFDLDHLPSEPYVLVDPLDPLRRKTLPSDIQHQDLLQPVMREGKRLSETVALSQIREHAAEQLRHLHPGILRSKNPHPYPAGLMENLYERWEEMLSQYR